MNKLRKYCSELKDKLSSAAHLGELCAQASEAHAALNHQVQAADDFFAADAPAAGSAPPSWMDVLEDMVAAMQQTGQAMLEAASTPQEKLWDHEWGSEKAVAAAKTLRILAAARLNRRHNEQQPPLLLRLPDNALDIIARKMGKRARLLCSKLCLAYGSPGAVLALPVEIQRRASPNMRTAWHERALANALLLWRHPIRHLDLSICSMALDQGFCRILTESLPLLQGLRCKDLSLASKTSSPTLPHPSLTSLHSEHAPYDLRGVAAFAPHLRTLHVTGYYPEGAEEERPTKRRKTRATPYSLWDTLASLPSLQSLHLPLSSHHLTPSADFCSTLQHLTALTHLGLILGPGDNGTNTLAADDALQATSALAELRLLASVDISNFQMLGCTLGSALQALPKLQILALNQQSAFNSADDLPGLPAGCLPSFSTMRSLEELTLTGDAVVGSQELRRASSGGSPPLKALVLKIGDEEHVPAACDLLAPMTALASLGLLCIGVSLQQEGRLPSTVAQLTQLRRLQMHSSGAIAFVPCPATLPALTCLEMHLTGAGLVESDLLAVERLTSLRRLVLMTKNTTMANREQCMLAVRKLPLLEDAEVGCAEWTEEELFPQLGLLLPPPEQLKRLLLATPFNARKRRSSGSGSDSDRDSEKGVADAVEQLESFGVCVILRRCEDESDSG